jgi:hypothetical protein
MDVLVAVDPDGDLTHNCWQAGHVVLPGSAIGRQGADSEAADSTATGPKARLL